VVFVLLPPVLMHLFRDYARFVNPGIHVFWFLLMIVGLTSAYFHATLSLIGENSKYQYIIPLIEKNISKIQKATFNSSFFNRAV